MSRRTTDLSAITKRLDRTALTGRLNTRAGPLGGDPGDHEGNGSHSFRSLLGNPAFLRLWLAQVSSQTAQNAIWWALFNQTARLTGKSTLAIGITILMVQLPTILFAGLSGVLVDRFSKRSILISSNATRAVGCLGYIAFQNNYTALLAITFLVSVINQPFQPAETATIPLVVEGRQLITANALFQITMMASQVLGYGIAVPLVGLIGISQTFAVSCAFLGFAALVLIPLPANTRVHRGVSAETAGDAAVQMLREIVDVARAVSKDGKLAIALIQLSLAPAVLLLLAQVGPKYVTELFGSNNTNLMILLIAPAGVGLGVGLFLIDRLGQRMPKERVASLALFAIGLATAALAVVPNISGVLLNSGLHIGRPIGAALITLPISLVLGLGSALLNAPAQTIVQERADEHLRGRVLAVQQALSAAVAIPPLLAVGFVGTLLTISQTLGIAGGIVVLAGIASWRANMRGDQS